MVDGKVSEIEDELNEALASQGEGSQATGATEKKKPRSAPRAAGGVAKTIRKARGPCRPYKKCSEEDLQKLIDQVQTRAEAMDAKLRVLNVRLKAYRSEQSMRQQDLE